jgi:hypothetical protein
LREVKASKEQQYTKVFETLKRKEEVTAKLKEHTAKQDELKA